MSAGKFAIAFGEGVKAALQFFTGKPTQEALAKVGEAVLKGTKEAAKVAG